MDRAAHETGFQPGAAAAPPRVGRSGTDYLFVFHAMATPCEVRIETEDAVLAQSVASVAETEARRIEQKFSRYRSDSVVGRINGAGGKELVVDRETTQLFEFARQCYEMSDGLFDVTSGVLRRVWRFDGSDRIPTDAQIAALHPLIGWRKVKWNPPAITLPAGMEIDLGGLAKEYAVDRTIDSIGQITRAPVLVNFGGDLRVSGPRKYGARWKVAIESVERDGDVAGLIELSSGALATSGDARRFLIKDGVRYSHILNPRTGRPVAHVPRSVTVAAPTCIEAGITSTLAMLQGKGAESFLKRENFRAWCIR